jgi:N-acetylmuramoyl-L-alanine amidase
MRDEAVRGHRLSAWAPLAAAVVACALFGALRVGSQAGGEIVVERPGGRAETIPVRRLEGQPYVAARDVARLTGASLHWRADVRKLVLRHVDHTLKLAVDTRWAVVDDRIVLQLSGPARLEGGEVWLPLSAFETVLSGRFVPFADWTRGRLVLVAQEPNTGPAAIEVASGVTRLILPVAHPIEPGLASTRASRFTVMLPGARLTPLPGDTLEPRGLVERLRFRRDPAGLWVEATLRDAATGYRLRSESSPERVLLEFSAGKRDGFVELVPEFGTAASRPLRVLVIDPGHGGSDSGYVAGPGVREKDLTLRLAHALRDELAARLPDVRVVLTRERDQDLPPPQRVEIANRARADLYLSLHFDGAPGSALSGLTAYVAPPLGAATESNLGADETAIFGRLRSRSVQLVSWQRAAGRHHGEASGAAELLLASLAADGHRPTRVRAASSYVTQGADCPAILLECATLSSTAERQALLAPGGMRTLALSLARALERYAGEAGWP